MTLPLITEEMGAELFEEVFGDINAWRKTMIHYIKDENPEVNTAIIEAAQKTSLDPKAIALGAYMTYKLLELAAKEENKLSNFEE